MKYGWVKQNKKKGKEFLSYRNIVLCGKSKTFLFFISLNAAVIRRKRRTSFFSKEFIYIIFSTHPVAYLEISKVREEVVFEYSSHERGDYSFFFFWY